MKKFSVIILIVILVGCYSAKDDCYHGMTTICNGREFSQIAHYQKKYSLGKTNTEQRWKDVLYCDAKSKDNNMTLWKNQIFINRYDYPNIKKYWEKFDSCMLQKDYILIQNCGRKDSKTDKGICNE